MKDKVISPQQYNELPRKIKRELKRQAKKEGRDLPEKLAETTKLVAVVDKTLFQKAIKILEKRNLPIKRFLDVSFQNLAEAEKKLNSSKLNSSKLNSSKLK